MNTEAIQEEIRCISVMLSKESARHERLINPLLERQIVLLKKLKDLELEESRYSGMNGNMV